MWQESDENDRGTGEELASWLEVDLDKIITIQTPTLQDEEEKGRKVGMGVGGRED